MKSGKLIENNLRNTFFFKYRVQNETGRLVPDILLIFVKVLYEAETSGQDLTYNIFWWSSTWTCNKNNLRKCSDFWSREILDFLEIGLGLVSRIHFMYNFSKNIYHVIFYKLTKFHWMIACTSWDIGQNVYCNYLILILWRHKF